MKETKKSGFGTASLVLGIIGMCTSFIPIINNLSFVLALIGVIFAIVSLIKKASKGMAIAGIVTCVIAIAVTISSQQALSDSLDAVNQDLNNLTGKSTEEILANDLEVTLGSFSSKTDSYGLTETKLPVTIKNKKTETKSFSIQIEAVDPNGSRITTDYIYANNLTAGQSQEFKVFEYVEKEKLNSMKNATFKIVEVSMY